MTLSEVFEVVRPSIVALGSKHCIVIDGKPPAFPTILGTGFFIDSRGIVLTNRHVAEGLQQLPPNPKTGETAAVGFVFSVVQAEEGAHTLSVQAVNVLSYNHLDRFGAPGPFYGQAVPDMAFLQLNVKDVPPLSFLAEPNSLKIGMPVATAGFPLGTDALLLYEKVVQLTPLLRAGIISSLYPFPCPNPHGFTVDIMAQGGASGSPIFLTTEPKVVGLLYGGYGYSFQVEGQRMQIDTNITLSLPSGLLQQAVDDTRKQVDALDLSNVPSLEQLSNEEAPEEPSWKIIPRN